MLVCPMSPETANIIDAEALKKCAFCVSCGRRQPAKCNLTSPPFQDETDCESDQRLARRNGRHRGAHCRPAGSSHPKTSLLFSPHHNLPFRFFLNEMPLKGYLPFRANSLWPPALLSHCHDQLRFFCISCCLAAAQPAVRVQVGEIAGAGLDVTEPVRIIIGGLPSVTGVLSSGSGHRAALRLQGGGRGCRSRYRPATRCTRWTMWYSRRTVAPRLLAPAGCETLKQNERTDVKQPPSCCCLLSCWCVRESRASSSSMNAGDGGAVRGQYAARSGG